MAALYAVWKRLSHLRLDDVNYDICGKQREDGRFTVAWVCLQCCEQGPPIPAAETVERAVSFAHVGLRAHHGLVHSKQRESLARGEIASPPEADRCDDSRPQDTYCAAYEQVLAAFEKLCTAHAQIRSCNAQQTGSSDSDEGMATACSVWSASACDFDAALEEYSIELSKRAKAIEAGTHQWPTTAAAVQRPAAATTPGMSN